MNVKLPSRLPLRRWMAVALVTVLVIPFLVTGILAFHIFGSAPEDTLAPTAATLRDNVDKWSDPTWQEATKIDFAKNNIEFVLYKNDTMIYSSSADPMYSVTTESDRTGQVQRVEIRDDTTRMVTAFAYVFGDVEY